MSEKIETGTNCCSGVPASESRRDMKVPAGTGDEVGARTSVTIDGHEFRVPTGTTILAAAQTVGVRIPTLCHHPDLCIAGVCRICVVEVDGQRTMQAACSFPINAPIKVLTHTPKVRRARRHILDLLLSRHQGNCYKCVRNRTCELRQLAAEYGIDALEFEGCPEEPIEADYSGPSVVRDMGKCILCRRCTRTCVDLQGVGALGVLGRSIESKVTTFRDKPLGEVICITCGQCINRCPTGALREKDAIADVWAAIDDPRKHVVIQTAPAPRAAIAEEFGVPPGKALTFEMNTAARAIGFDKVFDTNFTADLTIIEEATELLIRLKKALVDKDPQAVLPQFTSCSPGWIRYIEHFYPEMLAHLSSCKSPQQMFGALMKTWYAQMHKIDPADVVSVSLMPCSAKKQESARSEMADSGFRDIDYVLTTRELARMIKQAGIHLPDMKGSDFDDPFGSATGSGVIFGATGGVMEAALRTAIEVVCGVKVENIFEKANIIPVRGFDGMRIAEVPVGVVGPVPDLMKGLFKSWDFLKGATLRVGIVHGTANAKKVLEDIKAGGPYSTCHFIEFMACPGGCLGGGGQPIPTSAEIRAARAKAIYAEDMGYPIRKSHENPVVARIYQEFLKEGPCGHTSHHLLHTTYVPRGRYIV